MWTIPLDITDRWLDSAEVQSFLASNDLPDASADPLVRIGQFVAVTKALQRGVGRTFHSVQAAASALFDDVEGGVPVALKLASLRLVLREVYQTAPAPVAVPERVVDEIGNYVYALTDPRSDTVFHVGAGRGNDGYALVWEALALTDRLAETERTETVADEVRDAAITTIREIYDSGLGVGVYVLGRVGDGLDGARAAEIAAAAVTLDGRRALVDVADPAFAERRPVRLEDLALRHAAEPVPDLPTPSLLLGVPEAAEPGIDDERVRALVRGPWNAGQAVRGTGDLPVFVFADDIVRAVYRAKDWTLVARSDDSALWELTVEAADEADRYVGKRVMPSRVGLKRWPLSGWVPHVTTARPGR
ncbi:hypothetical protein Rrhod_1283 [Rhodococcus rhodnii LMG 5362]|uniref:GIY-YIG nuclease family protein n=1 Tax=Rhodococcus rhodnii LMG 5362 TaxID=1273125 RepID=R7WQ00_9NOCA|nr:hypothetical protein Rrhod_1283 [Rhodococcus rhodnii LMG 5362]